MLRVDFEQSLNNHRKILILVKPIGYIGDKRFAKVFEEISQYKHAQVPNSTRTLHLRYSQQISPHFLEWGSFHAHRKVHGLISVAICTNTKETEKMIEKINDLKKQFDATLLDSRCFVFCKPDDGCQSRKDFVFIDDENSESELEGHMAEFVASLFNVLESKRMSKLAEKPDKVSPLYAPVEQDFNGDDNRGFKRKFIGRSRKYLADLSLLVGLPQDALCHYFLAIEHLRAINDLLWVAGSIEGQCASSVAINLVGKDNGTKSLVLPTDCAAKAANVTNNGLGNDVDEAKFRNVTAFTYEEVYERLSEAIYLYGRIKGASIVEVEAHLKLTRLLISQKKPIDASMALQNALSVNITLTDQEKIQRYSSAAKLYTHLGFHRKAAFFTRVAAMQCVSPSLPSPAWPASYSLLLQAIKGYKILLDKNDFLKDHPYGWPSLQIRLMNELVFTARRLGDPRLPMRHMAFLLHEMHEYLTDAEKSDIASGLDNIARQCSGSPSALAASSENVVGVSEEIQPALCLARMPLVRCLHVHPLAPHLKPVGRKKLSTAALPNKGPFIFSSLRRNPKEARKRKTTLWVQGEVGQVSMEVFNPMPFELKVSKMVLCTEGVEFEPFPACLSLPPHTGPHSVILLGIPHGTGQLHITGYTVTVFGTDSTCPLSKDHLQVKEDFPLEVEVVQTMPLLQVSTSLPKVRAAPLDPDSPQSAPLVTAVTLYAGQRIQGTITLENVGGRAIESVSICLNSEQGDGVNDIFSIDEDELNSRLPLPPGESTDVSITITGVFHVPMCIGSSENIYYDPEAPWGLNGIIQFRYYGGVGADQLYRRVSMTIDVSVAPSLHCHNYDVKSLPSNATQCLVLFDADNKTSNDMELDYRVHSKQDEHSATNSKGMLSIQGNDTKKVAVYLPRFLLASSADSDTSVLSERDRRRAYSKAVREIILVNWRLPVCQLSGFGNLDNFTLDVDMLKCIKPDPVLFAVTVDGIAYTQDSRVTVSPGTAVRIDASVTNTTDITYEQISITFEPYQDYANGYRATDLHGKVAWVGELSTNSPNKLPPGNTVGHSCSFVFFYPGDFMIQIACTEAADAHDSQASSAATSRNLVNGVNAGSSLGMNRGTDPTASTTWTFSPILRITVVT